MCVLNAGIYFPILEATTAPTAEQEWTVNDMWTIDMDISIMRKCSKCGEVKEVCCLIGGKPWCEDCFDKALNGGKEAEGDD
jgi:formylmethanofuran dehydrogenase subunit E